MDLSLPRCRLSYQKIVQIESNDKLKNAVLWICHCRDAAYSIKRQNKQRAATTKKHNFINLSQP